MMRFQHLVPFRTTVVTINVLAVMVQFQQDNTPLTTGDGRFDLSQGTDSIMDAPPHNRQYFVDHLTFLSNYYRKVSKGKVIIRDTVLDPVFVLPGTMQDYSPPQSGSTIAVGNLARETWQKVDSSGLVPDFSNYQCFVILHAGTGRDIDLVSLLGYDPTPYDIPSLYIGLNGFRQYYGSGYEGIPVNGGSFHITNSIIIPETENRLLPTVTGTALLELSTNGLLCASVGNYLGLPDLFDTNTGASGIGRFGLMDGQAIFSFAGLFPPEPSAWEKYWLGWIEPITVQSREQTVALPAVGIATANGNYSIQDTVYRVPISAQEYFLIENRNRDPLRNGQTVTSTFNGQTLVRTFARDTTGFESSDISALAGVVTDVEDFDWSLPGGVDEHGTFFDGGTLIWHIDEAVIARGLSTNGVNGNPERRGVDLEEADGPQDIGQQYAFLSAGSGTEEGTALDFWYHGNGSPVNTNEFSSTTHPDSRSNSGANSHITINNFSDRGPHMMATVKVGDAQIALLQGFPKSLPNKVNPVSLTIGPLTNGTDLGIFVSTSNEGATTPQRGPAITDTSKIYAWKTDGSGAYRADGVVAAVGIPNGSFVGSVAVEDTNLNRLNEIVAGEVARGVPSSIRAFAYDSLVYNRSVGGQFTTSPTLWRGDTSIVAAVGGTGGTLYLFDIRSGLIDSVKISTDSSIVGVSRAYSQSGETSFVIVAADGTIAVVYPSRPQANLTRKFGRAIASPAVSGQVAAQGEVVIAFASSDGYLYVLDTQLNVKPGFPVHLGERITTSLAIADVDDDGYRDIIAFCDNKIYVYNHAGASLDNFPQPVRSSQPITSNPIVADVDGDGDVDIVAVTADGLVVAYDKAGAMANGFPLQAGIGNQTVAAFPISLPPLSVTGIGLAVASSEDGSVVAWQTGSLGGNRTPLLPWPQYQHDAQHTGLTIESLTGSPISSQFFPKERAYNWPNPVYEGKTFIRYFVKDNATVNIKVFDLAGDLVTTIPNPPGIGGVDNEVEWNVGSVQSGIYFARIEANGGGGSGVAVIKIAVVK